MCSLTKQVRTHRAHEVLRPFDHGELERIFAAADSIDEWTGQMVRFFTWSGCHIEVLCDPDEYNLHVEGSLLCFTRGKNRKNITWPIKSEMLPWIEKFLNDSRPGSTRRYAQILTEVGDRAGLKCNFLRLRHTTFVLALHEWKMDPVDVCEKLGVTMAVLKGYAIRPVEVIEKELRAKGF